MGKKRTFRNFGEFAKPIEVWDDMVTLLKRFSEAAGDAQGGMWRAEFWALNAKSDNPTPECVLFDVFAFLQHFGVPAGKIQFEKGSDKKSVAILLEKAEYELLAKNVLQKVDELKASGLTREAAYEALPDSLFTKVPEPVVELDTKTESLIMNINRVTTAFKPGKADGPHAGMMAGKFRRDGIDSPVAVVGLNFDVLAFMEQCGIAKSEIKTAPYKERKHMYILLTPGQYTVLKEAAERKIAELTGQAAGVAPNTGTASGGPGGPG